MRNMLTDIERKLLRAWRDSKNTLDLAEIQFQADLGRGIGAFQPSEEAHDYYRATDELNVITDKKFAALIKDVQEPMPANDYEAFKVWKVRNDAAQEKLSDAILEVEAATK